MLDEFLDLTTSYIGTKEDAQKLEDLASKCETFVDNFEKMMGIYRKYLEAVNMYKKAVPKPLSQERTQLMLEAQDKLKEAETEMKNFN